MKTGVAVVVALVVLGYGAFRMLVKNSDWDRAAATLPEELAKAKAVGMPLELEDIGLPQNTARESNAAPIYRKAFQLINEEPQRTWSEVERLLQHGAARSGPLETEERAARAMIRPIVNLAVQGSMLPSCDFDRDYSEGFGMLVPEFADLKRMIKLTSLDALLDAKEGDLDASLKKITACLDVAKQLEAERLLIAYLVQSTCNAIVFRRLEQIISINANSSLALAKIEGAITTFPSPPSYRSAIEGEVVIGRNGIHALDSIDALSAFGGLEFDGEGNPTVTPHLGNPRLSVFRAALEARYLALWRAAYPSLLKMNAQEFSRRIDQIRAEYSGRKGDRPALAATILISAAPAVGSDETKRLLLKLKLKALQSKLSSGRFPSSLDDLENSPIDPSTRTALRYRASPKSFVIYDLGTDGIDDGGVWKERGGGVDEVVEHPFDLTKVRPMQDRRVRLR